MHLLGGRRGVHQRAVNAVTEPHAFLERFEVHVAGAVFDGLDDDEIGQLDDGRFFAGSGQLVEVDLVNAFPDRFDGIGIRLGFALFFGVLNDVFHGTAFGGVNGVELVQDGLFGGDERDDFQVGQALDVVEGEDVERVGHGEEQFVVQARDGDDLVVVGGVAGEEIDDFGQDVDAGDVDGRDVKHAAHGDGEVLFADVGFFDDEFDQARAALLLLLEQFLHLDSAQQAVLDEGVGDAFSE